MRRTLKLHPQKNSMCFGSPEELYARVKVAGWLAAALERSIRLDSYVFDCIKWVCGDLPPLLESVLQDLAQQRNKAAIEARNAVQEALKGSRSRLGRECEDLCDDHNCLQDIITEHGIRLCREFVEQMSHTDSLNKEKETNFFLSAQHELKHMFGLDEESITLCEFNFILQSFKAVENCFEDHLEIYKFCNRRLLSHILDIPQGRLFQKIRELENCGIIEDAYSDSFRIIESLRPLWSPEPVQASALFCRQLEGDTLPLTTFRIPDADVSHVRRLLERKGDAPVHILLYGVSGTGKTTFARSLAKACGVRAWNVISRDSDSDSDRRASLSACLHLASKHEGAFVVVDEAERLLDTDLTFGRQTKDKAWLNDFLERPGQRIIWISNQVEHIDPAVRRRFSYSIHFEKLGLKERVDVWRQILHRQGLDRRFDEARMTSLAQKFPVQAAVIQEAVTQSASLYKTSRGFYPALERILQAHLALQNGGSFKPKKRKGAADSFTLGGVCMDGDAEAFVKRCQRVDAAMRSGENLRPGCGTMLFYGPPGTGKTALARYLAETLGRECMVKRASDLLSPYVGMAEQQIASAFREAEKNGAVLVIDEADTFLYSRDSAQRSWEVTLVNEFLTSLEECHGFCICTTNRLTELDAAALRRFSHKAEFRYADRTQVLELYDSLLFRLSDGDFSSATRQRLLSMTHLTPGDFHAVRAQYDPLFTDAADVTHEMLVDALAKEEALKLEPKTRRMGFLG